MGNDHFNKIRIHIGCVVKKYREENELSQFKLGLEIGKSANQIGRIERAESNPTVATLVDLADFFKIDIKEFFI
ncbi:helix-turn-helix domain-containing protein [Aequorivita marisscotiae]|uniref:Helix-turn-helix transcriptional regulator n=1 Tax=Aequorivita marisscotiae TaxID=3040348 RepID=A0ABY8KUE3_9FLAO|nr:helix-turn-helix transcriptional regulator [Aequorivita sp. Ant34-E75]WGF92184.1 helix-turn-helix transcriptional regulator [Aequorivita sp. Ant34-E75]